MRYFALSLTLVCSGFALQAQNNYPEPEFSNEVYYQKKDSIHSVMRLEKGTSKMEAKTKMGGLGGAENAYYLDGEKSNIRLSTGKNISFVFSNGTSIKASSTQQDSMMKANGFDPSMMSGMSSMGGMMDPASMITLYKVETGKGKRKVLMMKSPGAMPFGSKKMKSSDKFAFSIKKIREGYWVLVIDKPLPRGEYAFTMSSVSAASMDGSVSLFAFGIDD
jgi:hypothetical protein